MKQGPEMGLTRRGLGSEVELRTRAPTPLPSYDPLWLQVMGTHPFRLLRGWSCHFLQTESLAPGAIPLLMLQAKAPLSLSWMPAWPLKLGLSSFSAAAWVEVESLKGGEGASCLPGSCGTYHIRQAGIHQPPDEKGLIYPSSHIPGSVLCRLPVGTGVSSFCPLHLPLI